MMADDPELKQNARHGSGGGLVALALALPNWLLGFVVMLGCWGALVAYYEYKFDLSFPPSASGDEPDYDSLGWELANGRGYRVNSEDPDFRRPYDLAAKDDPRYRLPDSRTGVNTTRPPLYPLAICGLDLLFGRQLWATRVMDAWFVAATCALLAMWVRRHFGLTITIISILLFIAFDVRTRLYGRAILTEAMSLFTVTLLSIGLIHIGRTQRSATNHDLIINAALGVMTGICILVRSMMILWLPGLCLLVFVTLSCSGRSWRRSLGGVACFAMATVLTLLPWGLRNIQVTGEMMPMGTQGLVQMSAAFSDQAWEAQGLWRNLDQAGFYDSVTAESQTLVESEVAKAKLSRELAHKWIQENPTKTVLLFPIKIYQEFRPRNATEWLLLLLAVIGIPAACKTPDGRILLSILAINAFSIGMTWSVEGRFLVPVLFALHVLTIYGLVTLWKLGRVLFQNACSRRSLHISRGINAEPGCENAEEILHLLPIQAILFVRQPPRLYAIDFEINNFWIASETIPALGRAHPDVLY